MNAPRNPSRSNRKFSSYARRVLGGLVVLFLTLTLTGCGLFRFFSSPPKAEVDSAQLRHQTTGQVSLMVLQAQVMRFADNYVAMVSQACDDISANSTNLDIRLTALRWKLGQATAAYTDATGPNPAVNALDLLVLATMSRMVVEDYGVHTYGGLVQSLLETQQRLETNVWTLARGALKPAQEKELRDLIDQWHAKNPDQRYVGPIRFREFISALGKTPTPSTTAPTSIFSLLFLDPLAGLDPTAAAIQETRELGERAMYYSQRMPTLLNWQAEVLVYQLADQPESQQVLNDANRIAVSADIFAKTTQQLPQLINDQRQAAIQQILDGLTGQGNKSREWMDDTRLTFDSASAAATNINAVIRSLTEFVRYVSPTNTTSSAATNSHPFNVLDYGTAAAQISVAANNLNTLLASMNQNAPQIEKLGRQTKADADAVVRHAFIYGVILVLILLAGSVLAGLVYRRLADKPAKDDRRSSGY